MSSIDTPGRSRPRAVLVPTGRSCSRTLRLILAAGVLSVAAGCAPGPALDPYRRTYGPREAATVFSPIDLPAPNPIRTAAGRPGPEYWQQRVDYQIDATLDAATRVLSARQTITYTNHSPDDLGYVWLQLDQNLMRPGSDGGRISGRNRPAKAGEPNGYDIRRVTSEGKPLELAVYDSLARIELPAAVRARGGQVRIELEWAYVVPEEAPRMGIEKVKDGPIFELAQWFPAACVYDDVHGWNTLRYLGTGEFFTNFGSYDVRLTVPRDHLVAATGVLQNPEDVLTPTQRERLVRAKSGTATVVIRGADEIGSTGSRPAGDGPLTWHFVAHDVRTFAWASSAAFVWDAAGIATRGRVPSEEAGAVADIPAGTLVQSMYPREAIPNWTQSTDMLRFSIEHYNKQWYPYPYPVATNVNGPEGGMEYPMIIFCGARGTPRAPRGGARGTDPGAPPPQAAAPVPTSAPAVADPNSPRSMALYGVTTHEIGHNWFPMVVNTDEKRYAWMDEGFNSFINYYAVLARYPNDPGQKKRRGELPAAFKSVSYAPIMTYADYQPRSNYGMNQYRKTMIGLLALREAVLGPERFDRAFRAYVSAWAFKSPQPADFFRCMENESGQDLAWLWRSWFMETGSLDQSIVAVRQAAGEAPAEIDCRNLGSVVMPLILRVEYAAGEPTVVNLPVEGWARSDQWTVRLPETRSRIISRVTIDPEELLPDVDRKNNLWQVKSGGAGGSPPVVRRSGRTRPPQLPKNSAALPISDAVLTIWLPRHPPALL